MEQPKLMKPYKSFPLTPHVSGRGWTKHVGGRVIWIAGRDPKQALDKFYKIAATIRVKSAAPQTITVGQAANRYIHERMAVGGIKKETLKGYETSIKAFVRAAGRDTLISELEAAAFTAIAAKIKSERHTNSAAKAIQDVRTMLSWGADQGWFVMPQIGRGFVSAKVKRKSEPYTTDELRRALKDANPAERFSILLACNCAFGLEDLRQFDPQRHIQSGVIVFPRPKTGVERECPLWPETIEAIQAMTRFRPKSMTTRTRFERACTRAGVTYRGFYGIRHWFRTTADELEKPHAAARIMGHRLPGMAGVYVDRIGHDRLREITDHVRSALLGSAATGPSSGK